MKTILPILAAFAASGLLFAEDASPELAGLEKAAMDFVTAYNAKDAKAISELFTEDGEMADLLAEDLLSGREAILAHYQDVFAESEVPVMALEVGSVRLVAPNLAIEDGIVHLTPEGESDEAPRSTRYTAVLMKKGDAWKIASTRSLADATGPAGQLAELAKVLNGEWTALTPAGVRLDLAVGWDPTGKFLSGDLLVESADADPQEASLRIAWSAARNSIVSWFFDADGGTSQGTWTATGNGWLVRSEGSTSDGESSASIMEIGREGETLIWNLSHRIIDGERLPDASLRLNPPAPTPSAN